MTTSTRLCLLIFLVISVAKAESDVDHLMEAAKNLAYTKAELQAKINNELKRRGIIIEISNLRDFFSILGDYRRQDDILIAFAYSDTCQYSQQLETSISNYLAKQNESIADTKPIIHCVKMNVRTVKELRPMVRSYGSKGTPSLIGFRSGQFVIERTGVTTFDDLLKFIRITQTKKI